MAIDWENIFKDIGCNVRQVNILLGDVIPAGILAESEKKVAQFDSGDERLAVLAEMLASDRASIDAIGRMADDAVDIVKSYITDKVGPVDLSGTYDTLEEILAEMETLMAADSQSVDANAVTATTPVAGSENYGTGTCGTVTPNQMAKTQNFRLECYQEAVGETGAMFHVHASEDGLLQTDAEAGVLYDTGNAPGGVSFTIDAPAFQEYGDDHEQLSEWTINDYPVTMSDIPGVIKGVNTDPDGKIYVSVRNIGGNKTVLLYKDAARTQLIASGNNNSTPPCDVGLEEENGSGLWAALNMNYSQDDENIYIIPAFGYRAGDAFTFSTTSDDGGTFQSFFRDHLKRSFPASGTGQETILDAWAE